MWRSQVYLSNRESALVNSISIKDNELRFSSALSFSSHIQLSLMNTRIADLTSGALFGGALFAARVHAPAVITEQLQWTNLHMLKTFMTASAVSA